MSRTEPDPEVNTRVPAWVVAEHILYLRHEMGLPTTNFELLKLVYIAHGWMLGLTGKPLISDKVHAWDLGPVVKDIYRRYRLFGRDPIETPKTTMESLLTDEQAALVAEVVDSYKGMGFKHLFAITHHPDTPWHTVYHGQGRNAVIPDDLTREHYHKLADIQ